jgi:hypothetical protein
MAIRIEQLDMNNISKYYLLKKDLKPLLLEIISSLSEEEKEELGIGGNMSPEKTQLKALINQCETAVASASIGYNVGEYFPTTVEKLQNEIDIARTALNATTQDMIDATSRLYNAKLVFDLGKITENGVLSNGKWYGIRPLDDSNYEWIPVKIFANKYWVSTHPIDTNHPLANQLVHLYGLYVPTVNKIYTRFSLPDDILIPKVDGALYNDIWFGASIDGSTTIGQYLGKEVYFIKSTYQYVEANPPLIPESGEAWYGDAEDMTFLPPTSAECKRVLNIVASLGAEPPKEKSSEAKVTSTQFIVDEGTKTISGINEGTTVEQLLTGISPSVGSTVVVKDVAGTNVTSGILVDGYELVITSEDASNVVTYVVQVEEGTEPGDPSVDPSEPVTIGSSYYSVEKPTDSSLTWVPTKVVGDTVISPQALPSTFPNKENLTHIMGLYEPATNKVYTRFELTQDVINSGITKVDGALYNDIWFGTTDVSPTLGTYLGKEVFFIPSEYKYVEENPPLIPESGDAWYGDAENISYLPEQVAILKSTFNCVAAFGQ